MKQTITLFTILFAVCYIWLGSSGGAGANQDADRTGGPLSTNGSTFCSLCHSGGNFGTDVHVNLLTSDGDTITEYMPETTYTLRVSISAEGAAAYGFQAVALNDANAGAGTYGTAPSGMQVTSVGGVDYPEHSSRDDDGMWEIEWTSPTAGTGNVTFYAAGNAVNNASGTQGDDPDTTSLVIEEALGAGIANVQSVINLELSPNPVMDQLRLTWSAQDIRPNHIHIFSATGNLVQQTDLSSSTEQLEMNVQDLSSGIYMVRVSAPEGIQTKRFLKL
jgi:hypothetical protein